MFADDYQNAHLQASSAYKALMGLAALQQQLLAGWTTVRVMGDADVYYANQDIRKTIEAGVFTGPRLTGAAHYISITGGGGDIYYLSPEQHVVADGLIADGPYTDRRFAAGAGCAITGSGFGKNPLKPAILRARPRCR